MPGPRGRRRHDALLPPVGRLSRPPGPRKAAGERKGKRPRTGAGRSNSGGPPHVPTPSAHDRLAVYVAKLDPTAAPGASLLWLAIRLQRVAVDGAGNLIVLGSIRPGRGSRNFPVKGTPQLKAGQVDGNEDAFLVALAPIGGARTYVYGSLIGGDFMDTGRGFAIAPDGSWVVALHVYGSVLYTTPNAVLTTRPSSTSAYLRELPSPLGNQE